MLRYQISLLITTFLFFGFFFLALPEEGFSGFAPIEIGCCQRENGCDEGPAGVIKCAPEDFTVGAFCNDDNGLCTTASEARAIPTLSEWGLIAMAGILGIVGFVILRRRKVTA